jgi:hypothetical protein
MKKEMKYGMAVLSVLILAIAAVSIFSNGDGVEVGQGLKWKTNVCAEVIRANGEVESLGCKHNVLTDTGKLYAEQALTGTATNISNLALGNTTAPVAGDTQLAGIIVGCGLLNASSDYQNNIAAGGNWSIYHTWTSTCDAITVNTTGLYKVGANMLMFAGTTFTSTTLQTNDQIKVNYTISIA